jgi:invasion protein IalB
VQTIGITETRQLLLSVAVSKKPKETSAAMLLHLPLGLFNPARVSIAVDNAKPEMLDIQTCDARGCYAGTPMTPEKIAAMSSGTKLNVVFQDLKKRNITVPVPLKGFGDAYKKAVAP